MKKEKLKTVFKLFVCMLKIGAFTFGGGYAMLALLENEFVTKRSWLSEDEFTDMAAIAESTPGPIAINSATYIGYRLAGLWGAAAATLGVCIPSFTVIYLISIFFDRFMSLKFVARAFRGIQACVIYLILSAGVKLLKSVKRDVLSIAVCVGVMLCMLCFSLLCVNFSSVFYILISGAAGLGVYCVRLVINKRRNK